MARIWWSCFRVSGRVTSRTRTVKIMMAMPIWLKETTYNTIKVLSIGRIMISFQRSTMISSKTYPSATWQRSFSIWYLLWC